jgi:hypothetical protein
MGLPTARAQTSALTKRAGRKLGGVRDWGLAGRPRAAGAAIGWRAVGVVCVTWCVSVRWACARTGSRSAFDRRPSPGRRLRPALSRCRAGLTVDPGPREGAGTRALDAATRPPCRLAASTTHDSKRRRQTADGRRRPGDRGATAAVSSSHKTRASVSVSEQASRPAGPAVGSGGQRRHGTLCQAPPERFHVATQAPCDSLEMRTAGGRAARRDNKRPRPPMDGPRTHGPCSCAAAFNTSAAKIRRHRSPVCLSACLSATLRRLPRASLCRQAW